MGLIKKRGNLLAMAGVWWISFRLKIQVAWRVDILLGTASLHAKVIRYGVGWRSFSGFRSPYF